MFGSKDVIFITEKGGVTTVIDVLSKYSNSNHKESNLCVTNLLLEDNPNTYGVSLHCKTKELSNVLTDILELNKGGIQIQSLNVIG